MMKAESATRVALSAIAGLALAGTSAQAIDFGKANPLTWFKEKESAVPSTTEKQSQEAAAQAILRDAKTAQSTGDGGKAQSLYKDIVTRYRFTDAASNAQFEYAVLVRSEGKLQAAYDAFQKFINDYRQNSLFNDAIQQQFEIAEEARSGKKEAKLLMIPMKTDRSATIKMYQGVISNSPYGKYAPYAQFAIGEVYQDDGDKANANIAFQTVVENYPNTKLSSEAQFRIGAISSAAARKSQDSANLTDTRDALETYKATNPTGERTSEAESLLGQVNEAQAEQSLEIAKFYEATGKPKAAAIYYNEAIKFGSAESALVAREKLAALAAAYPEEMKANTAIADADYTIPAAVNLKSRDDYAGPPAPLVAKMGRKPEMRVEQDDFKPIPLKEPDLPTRPASQPQPGMLLPPAEGDKPMLLPVPAAPGATPSAPAPLAPPVPPAPTEKAPETPAAPEAPAPETAPSTPAAPAPASN
jgi:outer membrane protein assembly factor BamD (BamD/ComL family)